MLRTSEEMLKNKFLEQLGCVGNKFVADEFDDDVKTGRYDYAILAINQAREEAIRECAEVAKIIRYQPDPFGRTETALGSQQQDYIDKQSILNLINQIK